MLAGGERGSWAGWGRGLQAGRTSGEEAERRVTIHIAGPRCGQGNRGEQTLKKRRGVLGEAGVAYGTCGPGGRSMPRGIRAGGLLAAEQLGE